ncbi:MAG: MG2 domain-containing protein [Candidatus Poribacteria bacterium]
MFAYGQIHYHLSERNKSTQDDELRKAISEWERLVDKYPRTEESSLALFRIGRIYDEDLGDLEKALESYRKLNWGSWQSEAQRRIAEMTNKRLQLVTERVFRTDEPARVKVTLRNIEKVTISIYKLNLESYWRKMWRITGVEQLDIALIAPNRTWEYKVPDYQRYRLFTCEIEIPMDGAGVYAVNVGETDLEATTLVIRSDMDAIIKTSRQEVLVFAEDMLKGEPVSQAKVLVSDGTKVICEGETGDDGIFHQQLNELNIVPQASVFVIKDGNVASNLLDISGLSLSKGLTPRGYLYTDRPAYRPGQKVFIRGIIRDVENGVYVVPSGATYKLSIVDAKERLLREEELQLSEFGAFHTEMSLDENAPLGEYRMTAQAVSDEGGKLDENRVYVGSFQVQRFQLEKMKLTLDFPRRVYFRGEKIEATFAASFYYGQPVRDKLIRYQLPNGQSYTEPTDADGKLKVIFDTTSMQPGMELKFRGSIEGENVQVEDTVFLAHLGFSIRVIPSADVVLSGEPFDVSVETLGADGKPVGKELTLTVFRKTKQRVHPILSQIPWLSTGATSPSAEVKVGEHKIITDDKTGKGGVQLDLEKGGVYILRALGVDRFGQPVSGENRVTISDDKDAIKLRIFAERTNLRVGSSEKIRIHSRLKPTLALVTFEGEGIINYKILPLKKGWNDLEFTVGHEHFPNFHIAVAAIDGQKLRKSGKDFTVERRLLLSIKPWKRFYPPGAEAEIEISATDQLGKPVKAGFSLALVEEALFAIYPDNLTSIIDFFQEGTHRDASMRTVSSCNFRYQPPTRKVVKEIQEEEDRLELASKESKLRQRVVNAVRTTTPAVKPKPRPPVVIKKRVAKTEEEPSSAFSGISTAQIRAREEFSGAGYWLPAIATDANGKAVVKIPMPEKITEWRLTARGCTVETLVWQTKTDIITRKDFFVDLKTPSIVTEGDKIRVLARIHNLTDFAGDVDCKLTLAIDGKETAQIKKLIPPAPFNKGGGGKIQKNAVAEIVFDEIEIPAGKEVKAKVTARAGEMTDAVARAFPIRPWGMEYADSKSGVSSGDETVFVQLPAGRNYTSKRMTISVGPSVSRLIFDLTMAKSGLRSAGTHRIIPMPGDAGSDLLAAAYALDYVKVVGGSPTDNAALMEYARSLVARLVVAQGDDGGWSWGHVVREKASDVYVTSRAMWALAEARRVGVSVNPQTIEKGMAYLKQAFSKVEPNDDETKAVILHALSRIGEADFAYANRLYRNRNRMSPPALAYTALIFVNLKRNEIAGEILDVLEQLKKEEKSGDVNVCYWEPFSSDELQERRPSTINEVETTALVLLAMEAVRPNSPLVKLALEYLLSKRTPYGYSPYKTKGPVVAALAVYYQRTQFEQNDYRLEISVNGEEIKSTVVRGEQPTILIDAPSDRLADGENKIEFVFDGRGVYAYAVTLSGFSPEIIDPKSWDRPFIRSRKYYHAPLEYRGRRISYSTTEITQLEDGARAYVTVDVQEGASNRYLVIDEYLPAGTMLVEGSVSGNQQYYEVGDGVITFYYPPKRRVEDYRYQLITYAPGAYRAMPTVMRDAMRPSEMRIFATENAGDTLAVLAPGEKSKDKYRMNDSELYELGKAHFDDGKYAEALEFLEKLYRRNQRYNERELARMLLWMRAEEEYYNARKIVEYFEILRERFPELYIPFDKILVVGRAYRDMEEFERAYLVYKATIDASFVNDSNVSAVLQDEGQFLSSIDFQKHLWLQYPDTPQVISSYFALSQALYSKASEAEQLSRTLLTQHAFDSPQRQITKIEMLKETIAMLSQFLTLYPEDALADDATFSMANLFLDLEDFPTAVSLCQAGIKRYPKSDYLNSFQYVEALGLFSQRKYDQAVKAARAVADGESEDKELARYIIGQIYHAQGKPELAIEWYGKVKDRYPDARESISYFERKRISLPEVNIFRPDELIGDSSANGVEISLRYRNIKEATLQVYRVDLMKLYLREKDLGKIAQVQLAGIEPKVSEKITLGDGRDYIDKERKVKLDIKDEGAYLVICRGDDLFASGLVLITPIDIEVQEDVGSGRLRVNVRDAKTGNFIEGVHVKAIGSADKQFKSGETDLRGIFIADDIRGVPTVIARDERDRYAFYRGNRWLGELEVGKASAPAKKQRRKADYRKNIELMNQAIQQRGFAEFDRLRRGGQRGVQVQEAQ